MNTQGFWKFCRKFQLYNTMYFYGEFHSNEMFNENNRESITPELWNYISFKIERSDLKFILKFENYREKKQPLAKLFAIW